MKTMFVTGLVLGLVVSAAADDSLILKRGQVGMLVVGRSLNDCLTPADAEDIKGDEKNPSVFEIRRAGKKYLRIEVELRLAPVEYPIKSIEVFSGDFRTESGIGIGSTLADIRSKHPDGRLDTTGSGQRVATVDELGMDFRLEPTRALLILGRENDTKNLPEDRGESLLRVISIVVR